MKIHNKILFISIISTLFFLFACSNKNDILVDIAKDYIATNENELIKTEKVILDNYDEYKLDNPFTIIRVEEERDYNGYKMYSIYDSQLGLDTLNLPTNLISMGNNRYIAMFLKNEKKLDKKNIPEILLQEGVPVLDGTSWIVMMCKKSNKCIVISNGNALYEEIKQVREFTCDKGKEEYYPFRKAEDAIIDTTVILEDEDYPY